MAGLPSGQQIIETAQNPLESVPATPGGPVETYLGKGYRPSRLGQTAAEVANAAGMGVFMGHQVGAGFGPAANAAIGEAAGAAGRAVGAKIPAVGRALTRGVKPLEEPPASPVPTATDPWQGYRAAPEIPEGKAVVGKPAFEVKEPSPLQNLGTRLASEEGTANIPEAVANLSDRGKAAIQSLQEMDHPAQTPAAQASPFSQTRTQALGQRSLFSVKSNTFWQDEVTPQLQAMAKVSGDKTDRTLRQAMALYIDSQRDPVSYAENVAAAQARMPELRSIIARMERMTPEEKGYAMQTINAYDQARGLYRMDQGIQNEIIDNHVAHLWVDAKNAPILPENMLRYQQAEPIPQVGGKANPYSRFAQQRTIPTLVEGIAKGYTPRSLDVVDINRFLDLDTARTVLAKNLRDGLVSSGEGVWSFKSPGPDYINLGDKSRFFRNPVALPNPDPNATQFMAREQSLWVSKPAYQQMRFLLEGDPLLQMGGAPAKIGKYLDWVKFMELYGTLFHDFNLAKVFGFSRLGSVAREGIDLTQPGLYRKVGVIQKGLQAIAGMPPEMERLIRNGLLVGRENLLDALPDIYGDATGGVRGYFEKSPIFLKRQNALWQTLHPAIKAYDAMLSLAEQTKNFEGTLNPATGAMWSSDQIAESVASAMNKKYGGLNWDLQGTTQGVKRIYRLLMLAPDWTISNLKFGADAFKPGPEGAVARQSLARTAALYFGALEGLNMMMNKGQTTFQNERGHQLSLKLPWKTPDGRDQYSDVLMPGEFRDVLHALMATGALFSEKFGNPDDWKGYVAGKASPAMRAIVTGVWGVDYLGQKILQPGMPREDYAKRLVELGAKSVAPVPFAAQSAYDYATGQKTGTQTAFSISGLGSVRRGAMANPSLWNALPQERKAEFIKMLDDQERTQFSQMLARGRFTGPMAQQLRQFHDQYVYQRNQFDQEITQMLNSGDIQGAIQRFREEKRYHTDRGVIMRLLPYLAAPPPQ